VLRALAGEEGTATLYDLAAKTGLSASRVRDCLIRPIRCGWVTAIVTPQGRSMHRPRNKYLITDSGREHLASLAEEETRE
jgi:predicted ArsR family transcriptional regulator